MLRIIRAATDSSVLPLRPSQDCRLLYKSKIEAFSYHRSPYSHSQTQSDRQLERRQRSHHETAEVP